MRPSRSLQNEYKAAHLHASGHTVRGLSNWQRFAGKFSAWVHASIGFDANNS